MTPDGDHVAEDRPVADHRPDRRFVRLMGLTFATFGVVAVGVALVPPDVRPRTLGIEQVKYLMRLEGRRAATIPQWLRKGGPSASKSARRRSLGSDAKGALAGLTGDRIGAAYGVGGLAALGRGGGGGSGRRVARFGSRGAAPARVPHKTIVERAAPALTAASVGDADRFDNYLRYLGRRRALGERIGLTMTHRLRVIVTDGQGSPVNDARVEIRFGDSRRQRPVIGRTHADGRWDFFPAISAPAARGSATVIVQAGTQQVRRRVRLPRPRESRQLRVVVKGTAVRPRRLDLAFLIDGTGSMGDELGYVGREIATIVRRITRQVSGVEVRLGAGIYRDRSDAVPLRQLPFTTDVDGFARTIGSIRADGGGDYPEDVNAGLRLALRDLTWNDGNTVRVLVLVGDAPPQDYGSQYTFRTAMVEAARQGIRILPVAASGADRTVEYLFRALGAFTSTPYVYLTDDSGIGSAHMEADTDRVAVERFKDLITRLVASDLQGRGMHEPGAFGPGGQPSCGNTKRRTEKDAAGGSCTVLAGRNTRLDGKQVLTKD